MSITFIPQELVDEFIDILAKEGDIDSLRTLSLISHSFVVRCRQHLFASINLQGSGANRAQSLLQKVERLYQVLLRAPEIANYTHTLSFWVHRFNATAACIISKLLLQFSMINTFILRSGTSSCNWTLIDPELRFAFSHLAYSPTLKKFTLLGLQSFPVTFFTGCTNITDLNFSYCSMTEDHGSLEKSERDSIAKLRNLTLCGHNRGVEKLICGRRQDGSPILDISHLQTIYTEVYRPEALLATKELLNGASEIVSLSIQFSERFDSLNAVFQTARSLRTVKFLTLDFTKVVSAQGDPLCGLCRELTLLEGSNNFAEIIINIATNLRFVEHSIFGDLDNILILPGYSKLRRLHLEILLQHRLSGVFDRESFKQELEDAAQAQCSRLLNPTFTYVVVLAGVSLK